jgi:hypothetical protein
MGDLHVWHNDCDWVVAESAEDAAAVYYETTMSETPEEWEQWPDSRLLVITDKIREEKTCAEWVKSNGRGFLCSTEY